MNNNTDRKGELSGMLTKPSIFHGWQFIHVLEDSDDEAISIKPVAGEDGPSIYINPELMSFDCLEKPETSRFWIPMTLYHLCHSLLSECSKAADSVGKYTSKRWAEFMAVVEKHMSMSWTEIMDMTKREGINYVADFMASSLFVESGIQNKIHARLNGAPKLKIA